MPHSANFDPQSASPSPASGNLQHQNHNHRHNTKPTWTLPDSPTTLRAVAIDEAYHRSQDSLIGIKEFSRLREF
ncbi:hypothetical protein GJ744_011436 [Endocarpon pusillum]|uniref:Uncharacterized protein n=1 Tax=Endocarpon pusillum TaxID=364733 RepID=A0A8H7E284_9EURO|nr:hypothetical protein GJ744_011436 [Endocarpon pusillum]